MRTCTTDDLLLYLYGDLSLEERICTEAVLQENWGLREKLRVIQEAADDLDTAQLAAPSTESVQKVLDYLYEEPAICSESVANLR
jgi:hypothetical protein